MVVSMKTASLEYLSFIVRLWRDSPEAATHDRPQWLAQVESMPGGEKHYFVTPEALVAYLREQLGPAQGIPAPPDSQPQTKL